MSPVSESPRFESLTQNGLPWTRWASGLFLNTGVVIALIAIPVTVHETLSPHKQTDITLLAPPPVTAKPPVRKFVKLPPPPPPPQPAERPRVEFHAPPPKPVEAKAAAPPPLIEAPKPIDAIPLAAPKIDLPARLPDKQTMVKLETFQAAPAPPVAESAPVKAVQTGGFGESAGVSTGTGSKKVLAVGGFDSGSGGTGNGSGGSGPGSGRKTVASAGFGSLDAPVAAKPAARNIARAAETPVEITFKPKPNYTPEAREKKIEGEVTLEVTFSSDGAIHVLRVVRGLGFGLDENARLAASQIRFHPGTRNGAPVDVTGTVHIVFELS
jgi:TonB family protein